MAKDILQDDSEDGVVEMTRKQAEDYIQTEALAKQFDCMVCLLLQKFCPEGYTFTAEEIQSFPQPMALAMKNSTDGLRVQLLDEAETAMMQRNSGKETLN